MRRKKEGKGSKRRIRKKIEKGKERENWGFKTKEEETFLPISDAEYLVYFF